MLYYLCYFAVDVLLEDLWEGGSCEREDLLLVLDCGFERVGYRGYYLGILA